jgi:redox-sensing transcriptional repressor
MQQQHKNNDILPKETLQRFRLYQPLVRLWKYKQKQNLTIPLISEVLNIDQQTIYEDFSYCPMWDKRPNSTIDIDSIIDCIDVFLGDKNIKEAIIIGVGKLGTSLLKNESVAGSGLRIVAAFEIDPEKIGTIIGGIKVQSMEKLPQFVRQMHIKMAMIASTPENALQASQAAIDAGVQIIWNFTQTHLDETTGSILQNTHSAFDIEKDYHNILSRV